MRYLVVVTLLVGLVTATGTAPDPFSPQSKTSGPPQASQSTPIVFVEVPSSQSKINWVHDNGRSEFRHLPETCGGGGLFFDYDNDGWMDIYLVNSGPSDFYTPKTPIKNALYRNNGDGSFTDVTQKAGVACGQMGHFGMGAAAADYDGDGWQDLYVTNYGRNVLFHNSGKGTFKDVTTSGVSDPNGQPAHGVDYDNDAKLDLVSAGKQRTGTIFCGENLIVVATIVSRVFKPRPALFHNEVAQFGA